MLPPIPAALSRSSLDAPSTLLTPLSFYSAGHPPRSNFKSPAPIFPMFPLRHRYSWAIDPQLAAHCCVPLLSTVPPSGHTIRAWSMFLRLSILTVRRCHLLVAIFPPFADISIFVCPSIALSSSANRSLIEAPSSLAHGDFATFHLPAQLMADLSFPFYFLSSFQPMPFVVLNPKLVSWSAHRLPWMRLLCRRK